MTYNPDFILTDDNRDEAIEYLVNAGYPGAGLVILSNVELINLYHAPRGSHSPTESQVASAKAVMGMLNIPRLIAPQGPQERLEHYRTPLILSVARLGHPIMLVGPAGCGKTTIGEHVADTLKLPFYITNSINDTHELVGFVDGHGKYHETPFRHAYEHGGVWIADEIDAWDANALLSANSALANGFCNFPDRPDRIARHDDFRMIATANTFGAGADRVYVGRNELDAASTDRYAVISVDYDLNLEAIFAAGQDNWLRYVWNVRTAVQEKNIRHVVSSRAVRFGAEALRAGIALDDVRELYLFKGMSGKDRKKLEDVE